MGAARIYGDKLPQGYRDWRLISVARLAAGKGDQALVEARMARKQLRAQLGNDIAIKAFQERKLPLPDGAIIAALHWNEVSSDENNKVLGNQADVRQGDCQRQPSTHLNPSNAQAGCLNSERTRQDRFIRTYN